MATFGLLGKKLGHSFSKKYFTDKFAQLGLKHTYQLFEIDPITQIEAILAQNTDLAGLNVTIPYKEAVIPYLSSLDPSAAKVGAVNVIKVTHNGLIGYNSDYYGFKQSLAAWLPAGIQAQALVLGYGGAAKAVVAALADMGIPYQIVSRAASNNTITYQALHAQPGLLKQHQLIINTTPLGMAPNVQSFPEINYSLLGSGHYLYDLVYNPKTTTFMAKGSSVGANTKNGLEMLHLQAERSWAIWNSPAQH